MRGGGGGGGGEEAEEMESKRRGRKGDHPAQQQSPAPHLNSISPSSPSECYHSYYSYYSPRSLLSRILLSLRPRPPGRSGGGGEGSGCRVRFPGYSAYRKGKVEKNWEEEEEEVAVEEEEVGGGREVEAAASAASSSSSCLGKGHEGAPLNLGTGVGLVLLLATSAAELNKMAELRKQMEMLFTDIKNEIQKKDVDFGIAGSRAALISRSNSHENGSTSNYISFREDGASDDFGSAENAVEDDDNNNTGRGRRDQMEEELEVELERLRLNVEEKNSSVILRRDEPEEKHYDEGNEIEEGRQSPPHGGVSARELERRLHELLEARQKARIAELESALERAERDLREKEREISRWRRSARIVSQHKEERPLR